MTADKTQAEPGKKLVSGKSGKSAFYRACQKSDCTEINGIKDSLLIKLKSNQGRAFSPGNPENPPFPCMPKT